MRAADVPLLLVAPAWPSFAPTRAGGSLRIHCDVGMGGGEAAVSSAILGGASSPCWAGAPCSSPSCLPSPSLPQAVMIFLCKVSACFLAGTEPGLCLLHPAGSLRSWARPLLPPRLRLGCQSWALSSFRVPWRLCLRPVLPCPPARLSGCPPLGFSDVFHHARDPMPRTAVLVGRGIVCHLSTAKLELSLAPLGAPRCVLGSALLCPCFGGALVCGSSGLGKSQVSDSVFFMWE